jgi:hypothetical protein
METKVYNGVKVFLLLSFIIFITLFFASYTGYYDYENRKNANLTKQQMKKFEEDVKNGVNLDLQTYIKKPNNGYQNFLAKTGSKTSKLVSNIISSSVNTTFNFLIKFVDQK